MTDIFAGLSPKHTSESDGQNDGQGDRSQRAAGPSQQKKKDRVQTLKSCKKSVKSTSKTALSENLPSGSGFSAKSPSDKPQSRRERNYEAVKKHRNIARDIGPLPLCSMPEEVAVCEHNLLRYLITCFPNDFGLPFSDDHYEMIKNMEQAIVYGGKFCQAFPRGSGKTSITIGTLCWVVCYAKRFYTAVFGQTVIEAKKILAMVIDELCDNEILMEMFPHVCYPFSVIDHPNQASGQILDGVRTKISIKENMIVLPRVEGVKTSGVMIKAFGLSGSIRGALVKNPVLDKKVRPDFFIIDDPQTDESAYSQTQCDFRENLIQKSILGLAGPGEVISGIINGTVICKGDLMDRYLNGAHKAFKVMRVPFLYSWPENTALWEDYLIIRETDDQVTWKNSNEFYRKHRTEMDRGAVAYWADRLEFGAISAIQSAYNLIFDRGLLAFMSEFQNDPKEESDSASLPTREYILEHTNNIKRFHVPAEAQYVTFGMDLHKNIVFFLVAAWKDGGTGWIIDYGAYPRQKKSIVTVQNPTDKLSDLYKGTEVAIIQQGCEYVLENMILQPFPRINQESTIPVNFGYCDAGYKPIVPQKLKLDPRFSHILDPSLGVGIKAGRKPMEEYAKKPGEIFGHHWYYPITAKTRDFKHCKIDTNYWKTFVIEGIMRQKNDSGSITLFGDGRSDHKQLAEHLTAEAFVEVEGNGRKVKEWSPKPTRTENHLFDCLVHSAVAASKAGMKIDEDMRKLRKKRKVKYVRYSDLKNRGK